MKTGELLRAGAAWPRLLIAAADLGWLWFIFSHSLRDAVVSTGQSDPFVRLARRLLGFDAPWLEHFVRKLAHFTEFFILGCLAALTAAVFGRLQAGLFRHAAAPTALCGLLVAMSDETLQLFSAGRTSKVTDVWLDWAGFLCGALVTAGILALLSPKKT